ncbi:MAG: hypothetical protein U0031_11660 [Thermomicrobiales bacterium]
MDQERFDQLTRGLATGATRRGVVRTLTAAVLGGITIAAGVTETSAKAKKKQGGGKGKGKGKGTGAGRGKVAVCHYDSEADTYVLLTVSQSGWNSGHAKHSKDFQQADKNGCCLDSDCASLSDACHVGRCLVSAKRIGACQAVPTPDQACTSPNRCLRHTTCQADGTCGGGATRPCQARECNTVQCNPATGECDYTPIPGASCAGGTCNDQGACVCKPKTCAELGRTCGTAPDDGCGHPLDCGPASVCGDDISTNCCGGRCCKANGIACSSNGECCNGDCRGIGSLKTCWAFTDYTCAA